MDSDIYVFGIILSVLMVFVSMLVAAALDLFLTGEEDWTEQEDQEEPETECEHKFTSVGSAGFKICVKCCSIKKA